MFTHNSPAAALIILFSILLTGCQEYFDYSPYGIESSQYHLTAINTSRIESSSLPYFEPFKFAVAADTHAYYDEMKTFVQVINSRNDLEFLLIAGDLTDYGMQEEYQWMIEILGSLKLPYLTVIGNHDALNNGKENYQAYFGEFDYSFTFNQVKFVALNSNSWEFGDTVPRLDWLNKELSSYYLYQHQIVLTHILPYNTRFTPEFSQVYKTIITDNFVSLTAGGHDHLHFFWEETLTNGQTSTFLVTGTLKDRSYVVVTVNADRVSFERVVF